MWAALPHCVGCLVDKKGGKRKELLARGFYSVFSATHGAPLLPPLHHGGLKLYFSCSHPIATRQGQGYLNSSSLHIILIRHVPHQSACFCIFCLNHQTRNFYQNQVPCVSFAWHEVTNGFSSGWASICSYRQYLVHYEHSLNPLKKLLNL